MTAEQYKTDALPVPEQGTASYRNIHQLFKKLPHGEEIHNIFPVTYTQSVYDGKTGANLEHILHQFNHIFLQFQGTPQATRNLLPKDMRRKGIIISYRDMDNNVVTETNIDESESTSDNWGLDKYWAAYGISLDQIIKIIEDYIEGFYYHNSEKHINLIWDSKSWRNPDFTNPNKVAIHNYVYDDIASIQNDFNNIGNDSIHKIVSDINLKGGTLQINMGCTLIFDGGSISNGTLQLTGTKILPMGIDITKYVSATISGTYAEGQVLYDSDLKKQKLWNGTAWVNLDGTALTEETT